MTNLEPAPRMKSRISLEEAARIEEKIALFRDGQGPAITLEEAESFIDYICVQAKQDMSHCFGVKIETGDMHGACPLGQALTTYPLDAAGFNVYSLYIGHLNPTWGHVFAVAGIPVQTESGIREALFLVDTTYGQFFTQDIFHETPITRTGQPTHTPGFMLMQQPNGEEVRNKLLRDGHMPLNDQAASYFYAFNQGQPCDYAQYIQQCGNAIGLDFRISELADAGAHTSTPAGTAYNPRLCEHTRGDAILLDQIADTGNRERFQE